MDLRKAKPSKNFRDDTGKPSPWRGESYIDANIQTVGFNNRIGSLGLKERLDKEDSYSRKKGTGALLKVDRRANKYKKSY